MAFAVIVAGILKQANKQKFGISCSTDRSVIERFIFFVDQILFGVRLCSFTEPNRMIGVDWV